MYIHKTHVLLQHCQPVKHYKDILKRIKKTNLRRSSKYNIIAVLGALQCMRGVEMKNAFWGIYVSSAYSCIENVAEVVTRINSEPEAPVMPFDFLNVNSNNVSFYVAQALEATGKNMVVTAEDLGFEKALQTADFDLCYGFVDRALLGGVDTSLQNFDGAADYVPLPDNTPSMDGSCWIYANREPEGALARIEKIEEFGTIEALIPYLRNLGEREVALNLLAAQNSRLREAFPRASFDLRQGYYGSQGALSLITLAKGKRPACYVAQSTQGAFFAITLQPL